MGKTEGRCAVKRFIALIAPLIFCSACSAIRVKGDSSFLKMQRLAVFEVTPGPDATCRRQAESATSNFEQGFMAAGYRVAPRSQLRAALSDYEVSVATGITSNQAMRLGEMLGVQGIVIPSCERKGRVDWRLQVLDTTTGKRVVNSTFFGRAFDSNEVAQEWVNAVKEKLK